MKKNTGLILIAIGLFFLFMRINKKLNPVIQEIDEQIEMEDKEIKSNDNISNTLNKINNDNSISKSSNGGDTSLADTQDKNYLNYGFYNKDSLQDFLYDSANCTRSIDLIVCESDAEKCFFSSNQEQINSRGTQLTCITERRNCLIKDLSKINEKQVEDLYNKWQTDTEIARLEIYSLKKELEANKKCSDFDYMIPCEVIDRKDCQEYDTAVENREFYGISTWMCKPKIPEHRCLVN